MNSTTNVDTAEPDDLLMARADERLAQAYQQIARVNEQLSKLEQDAAHQPSAVLGRRPSRGRPALRGLIGLLLAALICFAAFAWQSPYGRAAKLTIAQWVPQLASTSWLSLNESEPASVPGLPAVKMASAESLPAQPAPSAQTGPQAAPMPPELSQLLQGMALDIARLQQEIEQLRAGQQQMASDNARGIDELKASKEQMTQLIAKVSEQNARPRTAAVPPAPITAAIRKPVPVPASQQAGARPRAPVQLQSEGR